MTGPKTNERPGTRALLRGAPMSAFKVRPVLDLIRGEDVHRAADILRFCERGPAEAVAKLLASAIANAETNDDLDRDELFVAACYADESKTQRRMRPRARGRATRIRKRSANITIIVDRLPEDRLGRLRAKREAEQAARRARRGGRAATPGDRARRTRRAGAVETPVDEVVAEELPVDETLGATEAVEVTETAADVTEVTEVTETTADTSEVTAAESVEATAETAAEPVAAAEPVEADPPDHKTPPAGGADHEHGSAE
ncbi:MAG: 50S ribosomal protein L22 [Acidimicrobiales bacterium]